MKNLLSILVATTLVMTLTFCGGTTETTQETIDSTNQTDSMAQEPEKTDTLTGTVLDPTNIKEDSVLAPNDVYVSAIDSIDAWNDKIITVKGVVSTRAIVTSNNEKQLQVTVSIDKDNTKGVFCAMALKEGDEEPAIKTGDIVVVKGKVEGMFLDESVNLVKGTITKSE